MATTIGTESTLDDLLSDLIQLDYDAVVAYQAAIDRLEDPQFRDTLSRFKQDHVRHTIDLGQILRSMGMAPPREGDAKSLLTKGKVVLGGLLGDKAILQAMKTNEDDTNTAYERAVKHRDASGEAQSALERGLADERRHREWMVETIERLRDRD
jgi:uncharacterized protein (TIGR02284 family)